MRQMFLTGNGLHPRVGKPGNFRPNTMNELNRRNFLLRTGTGLSAAWITANWPAVLSAATHAHNAAKAATPPKFEIFTGSLLWRRCARALLRTAPQASSP